MTKLEGVLLVACIGLGALFTSSIWLPIVVNLFTPGDDGEPPDTNDAIPVFKVTDGISDAAFSPADASVKVYDPGSIHSMPTDRGDVTPFTFIDTASESPDGEFTLTTSLKVGSWMYVYVSGTNYYTVGYFCQVQPLRAGTTGESETINLRIYPNSGTIGNDISAMLVSGGAEIDSSSSTSNVSFGSASYRLDLTVSDGYAFGNNDYIDPETGYYYEGTFVVISLDLTTARCTVSSSDMISHYTISSVEYWVLGVPGGQIINDDDITGDGTVGLYFDIDVSVGVASGTAAGPMDIEFYTVRRWSQILQSSFGTSYENDDIDDLYLDTS